MWCSCSSSLWIIVISYLSMASWLSDAPWSAVKGTALGLHSEGFYGCGELLDDAENVPPASYEYNVCTKNGYCAYLFHSPRATDAICETSLPFTPCCECRRLLSGALSCFKFAAGAALNDTPCDQTLYGYLTICLGGLNYRADIARVKFRNKGHGQGESSQWGWSPDRDVLRHDAGASRPTSSRTSAYAPHDRRRGSTRLILFERFCRARAQGRTRPWAATTPAPRRKVTWIRQHGLEVPGYELGRQST